MKNIKTMFVDPRKVGFQTWVRRHLEKPGEPLGDKAFPLQSHQKVIARFLKGSPYRGLLLYHGLGSGKSCAALAAAEAVGRDNVFVMLPASLKQNFEAEMEKCGAGLSGAVTWVSTNGIPPKKISRSKIHGKDVAGSCIVIDEVHNFISQVVNGGKRGTALFDAVFHAPDVKLIVLSGTPIINKPFEVGMLLNLVNGPETSHVFELSGVSEKEAAVFLKESEWVDRFDFRGRSAVVSFTPFPFYRGDGGLVTDEAAKKLGEQAVVRRVWDAMGAGRYDTERRFIYPNDEEQFNRAFLNGDRDRFVNREQFQRLAIGKVSYFRMTEEQADEKGFPRVVEHPPVLLEMSSMQLESYIEQRTVEIKLEIKLQEQRRAKEDQISSGVFRAFSRAVSNFAFDNTSKVRRVFPSTYRAMIKEMDTPDAKDGDREATLPTYDKMLEETMGGLEADPRLLQGPGLRKRSPKFAAILEKLKASKKALVYSQFRRVEGIGILELVLRANGFSRFSIEGGRPVYDDIDKPQFITFSSSDSSADLVRLYNGELDGVSEGLREFAREKRPDFRVLFITASGAEGLNLVGVREVLVTEPFWNEIRIQQVIGRAARVNSHSKLPKKDRVVDVYRFLSVIPAGTDNFTLSNVDKNLSTDQIILANAKDKMDLVNEFLDALRRSAIDCSGDCHSFPASLSPDEDVRDVPLPKRMQIVDRNGEHRVHDPDRGVDYSYDDWVKRGKLVPV